MCMSVDYVACKWRCAPFVMLILNKLFDVISLVTLCVGWCAQQMCRR